MKTTLASLWEGKGINVMEVGDCGYLFQFYHEVDVIGVLDDRLWTFNQHLLVLKRVTAEDQVDKVALDHVSFWVQLHNLPIGFHTSKIVQGIGDYVGTFLASDVNNFSGTWRNFLRVRVSIDIRNLLKRRMTIKKQGGNGCGWIFDMKTYQSFVSSVDA